MVITYRHQASNGHTKMATTTEMGVAAALGLEMRHLEVLSLFFFYF
jgi:hypothetical protein